MMDILHTSMCWSKSDDEQEEPAESYDCIILNTDDVEELNHIVEVSLIPAFSPKYSFHVSKLSITCHLFLFFTSLSFLSFTIM
mgnify:FL=1